MDLIDRRAAIDAINKALSRVFPEPCGEQILKDLPSAQPEVIRCNDCTYQVESWSGIKYCEAHGDHIGARREENG